MPRLAILVPLLAALTLAAPAGALAAPSAPPPRAQGSGVDLNVDIGDPGDQFVLTGRIVVASGETAQTLVIVDGPLTVARGATVRGDAVVVDGDARIEGTVEGRVVTVGGRAFVARTAVIGDGIRYGENAPVLAPGARVDGGVEQVNVDPGDLWPVVPWFAWWLAVSLSTLALGLLLLWVAPRAADATFARMRDGGWGPAIGVGAVVFLGLPLVAFLALVTLVGIPFGLGLLLALLPLGALGYVASGWVLGRALVKAPTGRAIAFLAGWGILRAAALVPVLGALVFVLAVVFGLGALTWAMWAARGGGPAAAPAVPGGPEVPAV
jgi:hypothetical protein